MSWLGDTEPTTIEKTGKKVIKYTKTKDLCKALVQYATAIGKADLKILKHPTLLAKKMKAMGLVEKEYRATGNTNCFMGIAVDEEKLSSFVQKRTKRITPLKMFSTRYPT